MVRDSFTAPAAPSVSQLNQMEATTLEWLQQEAERVSSKPTMQPPPPSAAPDGERGPLHASTYVCVTGCPLPLYHLETLAVGTQVHTVTLQHSLCPMQCHL